jgi:hypothetical protein
MERPGWIFSIALVTSAIATSVPAEAPVTGTGFSPLQER